MTERRERIPANEVKDSKRWNLPYWTEPNHLVHNEEHVEDDEEVLVEDEELEVEPFTAEQLEVIRQEACNEGLEQGLVEGRQKGEKLGHEEGYQEGLKRGQEEGRKLGFDSGFEQGEKQAFENGSKENEKHSKQLETMLESIEQQMVQQKQELHENLPDIILAIAKAVITEELSQGSEHIIALVEKSLDALPLDSGELKIEVNPQDLAFIEAAIEQGDFDGVAHGSDDIEAGGCRVHTRYSTVDFTLSSRWANIEKQYRHQLKLSLNDEEDDDVQPAFSTEESSLISDPQNTQSESSENITSHTVEKTSELNTKENVPASEDDQPQDETLTPNETPSTYNDSPEDDSHES